MKNASHVGSWFSAHRFLCLGAPVSAQAGLRKAWAARQEEARGTMVTDKEVEAIGQTLVDPQQPLQARFRALFTLRGLGGPRAITWISRAFGDDSALLKHELAYCLGQMQDSRAIPVLLDVLRDTRQEPMVRHEAGEWPGRGRLTFTPPVPSASRVPSPSHVI